MKIALYIEDGCEQVVLTPETESKMSICGRFHEADWNLEIKQGAFYECRGGWHRHGLVGTTKPGDRSTIIVLRKREGQRE